MDGTSPRFRLVVEVATTADRADWAELSSLTRCYVRVQASHRLVQGQCPPFSPGSLISLQRAPALLTDVVASLRVCDVSFPLDCTWSNLEEVDFCMCLYAPHPDDVDGGGGNTAAATGLSQNGKAAGSCMPPPPPAWCVAATADDDEVPAFTVTALPHSSLEGQWEALCYGESAAASIAFKRDIVSYVDAAMRFARAGVNPHLVTWNRLVLFYGPPGTGKTSLCRALAHKLAIRFSASAYPRACVLDINAHSLFSRWFSESGKQVLHLFEEVHRIAADRSCFVCCVMDEVESLAAARASAMKGNEPSDSIRVVNALLTQIDRLQRHDNILVLCTSNLTDAIDEALLDRADKRIYVGPPGLQARQLILQRSVGELLEKGLVTATRGNGTRVEVEVDIECDAYRSCDPDAAQPTTQKAVNRADFAEWANEEEIAPVEHSEIVSMSPRRDSYELSVLLATDTSRDATHTEATERTTTTTTATTAVETSPPPLLHRDTGHPSEETVSQPRFTLTALLRHVAEVSEGLNGRTLKKLPFLAFGQCMCSGAGHVGFMADGNPDGGVPLPTYLEALFSVTREASEEGSKMKKET